MKVKNLSKVNIFGSMSVKVRSLRIFDHIVDIVVHDLWQNQSRDILLNKRCVVALSYERDIQTDQNFARTFYNLIFTIMHYLIAILRHRVFIIIQSGHKTTLSVCAGTMSRSKSSAKEIP